MGDRRTAGRALADGITAYSRTRRATSPLVWGPDRPAGRARTGDTRPQSRWSATGSTAETACSAPAGPDVARRRPCYHGHAPRSTILVEEETQLRAFATGSAAWAAGAFGVAAGAALGRSQHCGYMTCCCVAPGGNSGSLAAAGCAGRLCARRSSRCRLRGSPLRATESSRSAHCCAARQRDRQAAGNRSAPRSRPGQGQRRPPAGRDGKPPTNWEEGMGRTGVPCPDWTGFSRIWSSCAIKGAEST